MKRLSLTLGFMVCLVCGAVSAQNALATQGKSLKIAMVLWRGETPAEQGLRDRLEELGYSVEYVVYDADQDREKLAEILREKIGPKIKDFDYVYCFGTNVTKMAKVSLEGRSRYFSMASAHRSRPALPIAWIFRVTVSPVAVT